MRFLSTLLLLAVVCGAYAIPAILDQTSLARQKRESEGFFSNTKHLVDELITNLNNAAQEANNAVKTFGDGFNAQLKQEQQKVENNFNTLRNRIEDAIKSLGNKLAETGDAAMSCVTAQRDEAEQMFQESLRKATSCGESRISEASDLLDNLSDNADKLRNLASQTYEELRNCPEQQNNLFYTGTCLATVAFQAEMKGATMLAQSGMLIGRINLFMATLPASLEYCAGTGLVNAGIGTTNIVLKIGSCVASEFTAFVGDNASTVAEIAGKPLAAFASASNMASSALESITSAGQTGITSAVAAVDNTISTL